MPLRTLFSLCTLFLSPLTAWSFYQLWDFGHPLISLSQNHETKLDLMAHIFPPKTIQNKRKQQQKKPIFTSTTTTASVEPELPRYFSPSTTSHSWKQDLAVLLRSPLKSRLITEVYLVILGKVAPLPPSLSPYSPSFPSQYLYQSKTLLNSLFPFKSMFLYCVNPMGTKSLLWCWLCILLDAKGAY